MLPLGARHPLGLFVRDAQSRRFRRNGADAAHEERTLERPACRRPIYREERQSTDVDASVGKARRRFVG